MIRKNADLFLYGNVTMTLADVTNLLQVSGIVAVIKLGSLEKSSK